MTEGNGDRLNRQIKASEAYANVTKSIDKLRDDLLSDDELRPGVLIEMRNDLRDLKTNPMVRVGFAFRTGKRAAMAIGAFAAACVAIGAGVKQMLG